MNEGWIKLHRQLLDNPLWMSEPFTRAQAWVDLLLLANHADGFIRVRGLKVSVPRGSVGWSEVRLAKRWRWSRGKVRRFISELETVQQIVQQKSNATSVIAITNYEQFQEAVQQTVQQTDSKRTADGQQTDTNKNEKKNKNEKNKSSLTLTPGACAFNHAINRFEPSDAFKAFRANWVASCGERSMDDQQAMEAWNEQLTAGATATEMQAVATSKQVMNADESRFAGKASNWLRKRHYLDQAEAAHTMGDEWFK